MCPLLATKCTPSREPIRSTSANQDSGARLDCNVRVPTSCPSIEAVGGGAARIYRSAWLMSRQLHVDMWVAPSAVLNHQGQEPAASAAASPALRLVRLAW